MKTWIILKSFQDTYIVFCTLNIFWRIFCIWCEIFFLLVYK